jgi:hypothetical protein
LINVLLPEPDAPVIATKRPSGTVTSIDLRLFSRAPRMTSARPLPFLRVSGVAIERLPERNWPVGEALQPIDLPRVWYLVIEPAVSVPTAEIFAAPNLTRNTKAIKMADFSAGWGAGRGPLLFGQNDLEPVVCGRYPEVARALAWLRQHAEARMTGSGACVFAPFAAEQDARAVLARMPEDMVGWIARGLDEHPLRALAD